MTLIEWRKTIEKAMSEAGFENASLEAKWLLEGLFDKSLTLNPTYIPHSDEVEHIRDWVVRRVQGEPLSRIKGIREFWSLPFHINEFTLDPRPETELIVESVLKWIGNKGTHPWRLLDLGTGSGCLLISLLYELKSAIGTGIDVSDSALDMARFNAALNGVSERATFHKGNWGKDLLGPYDIIVSNPPYIPLSDRETLEKGVRDFDPPQALFGGEDGLACYRILAHDINRLLTSNGLAVLEFGIGQRPAVEKVFRSAGLQIEFILKDLAGIERTVGITRAEG